MLYIQVKREEPFSMSSKMRITSLKFTRNGEIALVLVKWAPRARPAEQGAHHKNLSRKIRLKMNSNRMRNILYHQKDLIKTRRVIGQCGWAWDWDALTCLALGGLSNDHGDGKESGKKANYARASHITFLCHHCTKMPNFTFCEGQNKRRGKFSSSL